MILADVAFALALHRAAAPKRGNFFFSPYGVSSAFAVAYLGARGETAKAMAKTLGFEQADIHEAFGDARRALAEAEPAELRISNAVWPARGLKLERDFVEGARKHHGARVEPVDYSSDALRRINAAVSKDTKGKIPKLLTELDASNRCVLTNALYFKAGWRSRFDEGDTRPGQFHLLDGKPVEAPLMRRILKAGYFDAGVAQVASLPYAGDRFRMAIVLPKKADGLLELERKTKPAELVGWLEKAAVERELDLTLPRFTVDSRSELAGALSGMGMASAFGPEGDYSGITKSDRIHIDQVVHQAVVEVTEEGTEAAAATALTTKSFRPDPPKPVEFKADHPFLFFIEDTKTGVLLFVGRLEDPRT